MKGVLKAIVGTLALLSLNVQAAVVSFTPTTGNDVPRSQNLYWNMLTNEASSSSISGAPCGFYLSDHGDFHYSTSNGCAMAKALGTTTGGKTFTSGEMIGASNDWLDTSGFLGTYAYEGSMQPGDTATFGVRFQINGNTHYGWVNITEGLTNHSVNAWAYESTPNTPIAAFSTSSSIKPVQSIPTTPFFNLLLLSAFVGLLGCVYRRRLKY